LYIVLSGLDEALTTRRRFVHNSSLQVVLASESFLDITYLTTLPSAPVTPCLVGKSLTINMIEGLVFLIITVPFISLIIAKNGRYCGRLFL
jgi:hypothetical protein